MADLKYMRKIQSMCRCQDYGRMVENTDIDDPYRQKKMKVNGVIFNKKSILAPLTGERNIGWQ